MVDWHVKTNIKFITPRYRTNPIRQGAGEFDMLFFAQYTNASMEGYVKVACKYRRDTKRMTILARIDTSTGSIGNTILFDGPMDAGIFPRDYTITTSCQNGAVSYFVDEQLIGQIKPDNQSPAYWLLNHFWSRSGEFNDGSDRAASWCHGIDCMGEVWLDSVEINPGWVNYPDYTDDFLAAPLQSVWQWTPFSPQTPSSGWQPLIEGSYLKVIGKYPAPPQIEQVYSETLIGTFPDIPVPQNPKIGVKSALNPYGQTAIVTSTFNSATSPGAISFQRADTELAFGEKLAIATGKQAQLEWLADNSLIDTFIGPTGALTKQISYNDGESWEGYGG